MKIEELLQLRIKIDRNNYRRNDILYNLDGYGKYSYFTLGHLDLVSKESQGRLKKKWLHKKASKVKKRQSKGKTTKGIIIMKRNILKKL